MASPTLSSLVVILNPASPPYGTCTLKHFSLLSAEGFILKLKKMKKEKGKDEVLGTVLGNALHRVLQVAGSSFLKATF